MACECVGVLRGIAFFLLFVHASPGGLFSPKELEVAQGLCGGLTTFVSHMNDLNSLNLSGSVSLTLSL